MTKFAPERGRRNEIRYRLKGEGNLKKENEKKY